jgi:hypothetical protein
MALQHLRSSTADKRPTPAAMSDGQLALNTNLVSPGLFLKDSNGDLVKVGPVHVGTTAPNVTPGAGGQAGNSKGEQWLDTSSSRYVFKIWDGTAWRSEDGEFVNASGDTMTGALVMDNQQQVRFRETTANGTNFIAIEAPASVTADRTLTLPDVTGTIVSTGDTGSVTSTMILDGTILNADINASAAIVDTKLATIATAGKVSNSATTATDANTASAIVARDASGNFNVSAINNGPLAGFRNAIINGGMQVAQRAAPTITATPQYGQADRFVAYISGGTGISGTINQGADAQFKSGYRLWMSSLSYTSGTWAIQQKIESFNSIGLNGSTVTVSFKLYHDFGSSRTVTVQLAKANALDNFSTVTAISSPYISPALTSGAYSNVSCSFAIGASDATNGLLLQINDSSATTVSAKNVIIGDVQLEPGPVATPFERRPIGTELALCQRYYCETRATLRFRSAISSEPAESAIYWPQQMRTAPSVAIVAGSRSNALSVSTQDATVVATRYLVNASAANTDTYALNDTITASAEL